MSELELKRRVDELERRERQREDSRRLVVNIAFAFLVAVFVRKMRDA